MLNGFARRRGEKLNLEKDVYYTEITGLREDLLTHTKLRRGIDEGFFGLLNLQSTTTNVKEFIQTINAIRNRGHVIIINLTKITRGAKAIIELANYWFHKPQLDTAILYIRDREFVGDDPWSIFELLNARTLGKKRYLMKNNPNYVTWMKIRPVPKWVFDNYEKYKLAKQEEMGKIQKISEEGKKRRMLIMDTLEKEFREKDNGDYDRVRRRLVEKYKIPEVDVDKWISRLRKHMGESGMAKEMLKEQREGSRETDENFD